MTRRPDNAGWREIFRASLILPTTVVGIVLPLDFISQTDGYVVYLRPWELVPVYAWALLFYLLIGSAASVMAVAIASGTSLVARKKILPAVVVAEAGLAFSVLTLTLVRAGKLWMASHGSIQLATWMSRHQQSIIIFAVIGCFTWAFARGATVRKIEPAARCGGAIGLFVVLLSPVFVFSHNTDIGKSRTMDLPSGNGVAHPNIVLITIDALAANHLSLYGYPRTTSPNLERLAGEADTFDRYYANSNFTTPTVNSFINGVRPWTHRANQPLARVDRRLADQGLVARLKRSGYQTFAVSTNPIASPFHNLTDHWFDKTVDGQTHEALGIIESIGSAHFSHFLPISTLSVFTAASGAIDHLLVFTRIWQPASQHDPELPLTCARQLLLRREPGRPVFLWVHLLPPHSPYAAPAPFLGRFDGGPGNRDRFYSTPPWQFRAAADNAFPEQYSGRYDESVAYVDDHIGSFLNWLKAHSLFDQALLVISADHGENFTHHYGGHGGPMLYEDMIRIPLLIKAPNQTHSRRVSTLSEQIDLMPTILDMAGISVDTAAEGRSLVNAKGGPSSSKAIFTMNFEENPGFGNLQNGTVAMIEGDLKYTHYFGVCNYAMMPQLADSLYDLQSDPAETTNLITAKPDVSAKMLAIIQQQLNLHSEPQQ